MKKWFWLALVLVLVFVGGAGFWLGSTKASAPSSPETTPVAPGEPLPPINTPFAGEPLDGDSGESALQRVDLDAVRTLYAPDTVYARVGEREITWAQYAQWLESNVLSAENYLESMAAYGLPMAWDSDYDETHSFAAFVTESLNENLRVYTGIDQFAHELGYEISDEELDEAEAQTMREVLGEDAGADEWAALLAENFLTEDIYRTKLRSDLLLQKAYDERYGTDAENISDETVERFLADNDYLRSNHILFLTMDMNTRESLDEETIAAKKAQAEKIAAELQGITDQAELLARFAALKEELDEDSGKVAYPTGYLFSAGQMVPEFEETSRTLEVYQVSDPVLTTYGYHVIIRLPIERSDVLDTGSTVAEAAASAELASELDAVVDTLEFELAEDVAPVDLLAHLKS